MAEGAETEPEYFRGLARSLRATGVELTGLMVSGAGRDPLSVVREAAERAGLVHSKRPTVDTYEQVWCVVDVDRHETLPQAKREAEACGIRLAVSNPCFELWLAWHFGDYRRHADRRDLERYLSTHRVTKHLPPTFPYEAWSMAVERAHDVMGGCCGGSIPRNPGSGVCEVVRAIHASARHIL